jgi:hypothetical protein
LAFSYWIDNLGFVTEEKLATIFIKPSLGVSNWPAIYIINYMPTSSLALFNTAPSRTKSQEQCEMSQLWIQGTLQVQMQTTQIHQLWMWTALTHKTQLSK